jgi:hypothetical protein
LKKSEVIRVGERESASERVFLWFVILAESGCVS